MPPTRSATAVWRPSRQQLAQQDEALAHDMDDPAYWFGGFPKAWWSDASFVAWVNRRDQEYAQSVNRVLRRAHGDLEIVTQYIKMRGDR